MLTLDEKGYIKYNCRWTRSGPLPESEIEILNRWRAKLHGLGLIGASKQNIGYGNISRRIGDSTQFIVTGSNTGHLPVLDGRHYARVLSFDFRNNTLSCQGPIQASSESLTHAAIYSTVPEIKGVIHVHSLSLWQSLIDKLPATSRDVEYGTPEMAAEMVRVLKEGKARELGIVIMGGHQEGIVTFGKNLDEAGEILLRYICSNVLYEHK